MYGDSSQNSQRSQPLGRSGISDREFENQLNMAEAMANSILNKFDDARPASSMNNPMEMRRNQMEMNQPRMGGMGGNDGIGGQIVNELARLSANPDSRW